MTRPAGRTIQTGLRPKTDPAQSFAAELQAILPLLQTAQARFSRTSIGLSFRPPEAWPSFADSVLDGQPPIVPELDTTALSVRFLCADIKALYDEAAQAVGHVPSASQVDSWFWRQTAAGALLQALRRQALDSDNNSLKTVGGRFFVPTPWVGSTLIVKPDMIGLFDAKVCKTTGQHS